MSVWTFGNWNRPSLGKAAVPSNISPEQFPHAARWYKCLGRSLGENLRRKFDSKKSRWLMVQKSGVHHLGWYRNLGIFTISTGDSRISERSTVAWTMSFQEVILRIEIYFWHLITFITKVILCQLEWLIPLRLKGCVLHELVNFVPGRLYHFDSFGWKLYNKLPTWTYMPLAKHTANP